MITENIEVRQAQTNTTIIQCEVENTTFIDRDAKIAEEGDLLVLVTALTQLQQEIIFLTRKKKRSRE